MADSAGEKTEKATPKRKRDERKKGNVFSSKDLVAAFTIILFFAILNIFGKSMFERVASCMIFWFSALSEVPIFTQESITEIFKQLATTVILFLLPIMVVSVVAPIIFTGMQTKFLFSKEALKPKFSRLNPIQGVKNLISLRSVVELLKNLLKLAIIVAIIYNEMSDNLGKMLSMTDVEPASAVVYTATTVFSAVISISIIFIFLGIADLFYQWYEYEKKMKMTKQEVKEEYKQMEGDPQIKGAIKQRQRAMAQARMMQDVPDADVVIRNPTHFAIAIKYDPDKNTAPVVLAKGMDFIALKIIEVATQHNVSMQENKPLARALYDNVNVGQQIPEEFYQEVAEVLAFVYSLKNKMIK